MSRLHAAALAYRRHRQELDGQPCKLHPCHYAQALDLALECGERLCPNCDAPMDGICRLCCKHIVTRTYTPLGVVEQSYDFHCGWPEGEKSNEKIRLFGVNHLLIHRLLKAKGRWIRP